MTPKRSSATRKDRDKQLRLLYEQLEIAASALMESHHWLAKLSLASKENVGRVNRALTIIHSHRYEIVRELPELDPPQARLWSDEGPPYGRNNVLRYLFDQLRFADTILRDAGARASTLNLKPGIGRFSINAAMERTGALKNLVGKLVDEVTPAPTVADEESSAPRGRLEMLGLLDQDLTLAAEVLNNCAGLFRELDFNPSENIHALGECLGAIFGVHDQIYAERPDLIPESLREAYEDRRAKQEGAR